MNGIKAILRRTLELLRLIPKTEFVGTTVPASPSYDGLRPGQVVVVGDGRFQKWAYLRCPCGCFELIMLSLSTTKRPSWRARVDWLDRPTLEPSVRQTGGCYSHFWHRTGRVEWCADTGIRAGGGSGLSPAPRIDEYP
jgi:Family of unknown function (DUF6527)